MAIDIEARHDWWVRTLKRFDESGLRDVTDRQAREAARAALDYLEEHECPDDEFGFPWAESLPPEDCLSRQAVEAILAAGNGPSIVLALRQWYGEDVM